ncbi:uncharacterized protein F5Z01DRAFT_710588 [Emericellopsis atlantica]|uniref:Uncharacterized protein n=1 Tax=Emericellopsis atlantica TaxID=2614577 RepID=A0A9P8CMB8_9HYPO|nr:uncharacterized protein F5Z01DRAFT_710588 [Emericellopsis atlantica]KAG9252554.1 hypothetical protein F5Z01DRAFT_710588 [Emericellopsis atlantica]
MEYKTQARQHPTLSPEMQATTTDANMPRDPHTPHVAPRLTDHDDPAIHAMEAVYGPLTTLMDHEVTTWTPPPGSGGHLGRYLWTDAFGVLNFITLAEELDSSKYLAFAMALVTSVHDTLGRTRDQSRRLDHATDKEPLKGGLRIGKAHETGDDGDGQYHHYLTMWMFALNRLSVATGDPRYNDLALQLAQAIHPRFFVHGVEATRMVYKISVDMETVLNPREGSLDAILGLGVFRLLQATAVTQGRQSGLLKQEIAEYEEILRRDGRVRPSSDLLDLGMGLWATSLFPGEEWAQAYREASLALAEKHLDPQSPLLQRDPSHRLAFREFGACLGILCDDVENAKLTDDVRSVLSFWEHHVAQGKGESVQPISKVMYAACRHPGAFKVSYLLGKKLPEGL